jgi:hypothetical protein
MDYKRYKHLFPILYPIVAKNVWGCFTHDIVTSIDISIDFALIASFVHATLDTPAAKNGLTLDVPIGWNWVKIEKASLACIALFSDDDLYSNKPGFVTEHVDETGMR